MYSDEVPPADEFPNRIERTRDLMRKQELDGLLIYSDAWRYGNVRYFANYRPFNNSLYIFPSYIPSALIALPIEGDPVIFVSDVSMPEFKEHSLVNDTRPWRELLTYLKGLRTTMNLRRMGISGREIMAVSVYEYIRKALADVELTQTDIISIVRAVKSEWEIDLMTRAAETAHKGMMAAVNAIEKRKREGEVAREAEMAILSSGAEGIGFDTLVQSGPHSWSSPIYRPTDRRIRNGDMVFVDLSANWGGYCSDHSRGIVVGPSKENEELLRIIVEAHSRGRGALRPRTRASEIEKAISDVIADAGYDFSAKGLHGIGMDSSEPIPSSRGIYDVVLEPNMTVVVKAEMYVQDVGGARIEDVMVVTPDGNRVLTKTDYELILR